MTYSSPINNQDGVSRSLSISESENNRVHKEIVDGDLDKQKKLQDDDHKGQQVNDLRENDQLDEDGRGSGQHSEKWEPGSSTEDSTLHEFPPAHIEGGDFIDLSA